MALMSINIYTLLKTFGHEQLIIETWTFFKIFDEKRAHLHAI